MLHQSRRNARSQFGPFRKARALVRERSLSVRGSVFAASSATWTNVCSARQAARDLPVGNRPKNSRRKKSPEAPEPPYMFLFCSYPVGKPLLRFADGKARQPGSRHRQPSDRTALWPAFLRPCPPKYPPHRGRQRPPHRPPPPPPQSRKNKKTNTQPHAPGKHPGLARLASCITRLYNLGI